MSVERQNLTIETEFHSDSRETWLFLSMSRPNLEYGEHVLTIETELYSDSRETWLLLSMSRPNLEYGEHVLTIETELYSDSRETWPLLSMSRPNLKCGGHVSSRGKQKQFPKMSGGKKQNLIMLLTVFCFWLSARIGHTWSVGCYLKGKLAT